METEFGSTEFAFLLMQPGLFVRASKGYKHPWRCKCRRTGAAEMRIAKSLVAPVAVATAVIGTAALSVVAGSPFEAMSKATTTSAGTSAGVQTSSRTVAAKIPGWRVIAKIGPFNKQVSGTLAANGPRVAWSVWKGQGFTAVERWNGKTWKQVAVPAKLTSYVRSAVAFDGSSIANFWLFNSAHPAEALRYSGTKWTLQKIPSWAVRKQASGGGYDVVTNVWGTYPNSHLWVFSLNAGAYAAYYNGHAWHKETLPETPVSVSVDASNDIWALGTRNIMHWNPQNGGWRTVQFPSFPPGGLPIGTVGYPQLTAASPHDVWLIGQAIASAGPGEDAWFGDHGNGKGWGFFFGTNNSVGSVAPDGNGGLWADTINANPSGFWLLDHLSGSKWAQVSLPAGVLPQSPLTLTYITGSRSLWATAQSISPQGTKALILKYGP
jgi:hypothetical protein